MLKLKAKILAILNHSKYKKSPEAEANLILLHAYKTEIPQLDSFSDLVLRNPKETPSVEITALSIANQRATGIPLQHLLGVQFFYEHEYAVDDSTLIPRPETEILVQAAIQWLEKERGSQSFNFAELGLGSGVIATEILSHFKNASAVASELSSRAITLAKKNLFSILGDAAHSSVRILEPTHSDSGFEIFLDHAPFDLVISNPPYVSRADPIEEEVAKYEPRSCLYPETDGPIEQPNYFYENFILHSKTLLKPNGIAFFEVPHERAQALAQIFKNAGFLSVQLIPDLTGRNRVLRASLNERTSEWKN